ncbi:hypothetical protein FOL47_005542 [Perkinsus chesapeaki]|uniref:Uncharacterized protein n=1 Tax=Perkinsus chesapeaki TaxID=330153 RepID=A0A7J6LX28_PERCH|nr:hypothetical protein FOL47_005542 [Perkinsus chesapeaki]
MGAAALTRNRGHDEGKLPISASLLLRPGAWQLLLRTNNPMASLENEVDIEAISTGCARFFPEFRFASTKPNFTCSFEDVVKGTVEDNTLCGGFPEPNEEAGIYLPADPDTFCNLEPIPARCLEESFRMVKSRDIPSDAPDFENDEYTPFMEYQSDRGAQVYIREIRVHLWNGLLAFEFPIVLCAESEPILMTRYRFALHVLEHIGCGLRYWVTQGNAISILRHGAFFGRMPSGKWDLVDSDLDINIVLPKAKSTGTLLRNASQSRKSGLTMRHLLDHLQHSGGRFSCNDKKFSGKTVHCWVLCWKGQKEYGLTQPWKHLSGGKSCLIKEYCDAEADKNCGAVELK